MMKWRWDQGRLKYFQFDSIRSIAAVLLSLDGTRIDGVPEDPLRDALVEATGFPFSPDAYKVWRNYARVFKCSLLVSKVDKHLRCTDLCKRLVNHESPLAADEYLAYIAQHFYYPSPVFEDYNHTADQVFPFSAILKLLLHRLKSGQIPRVSLDEVFGILIGNECTGRETVDEYGAFTSVAYTPEGDEDRQLRELLIFISQFSFMKWDGTYLYIDVDKNDAEGISQVEKISSPVIKARLQDPEQELLTLGGATDDDFAEIEIKSRLYSEDEVFTEGKKVRVTHLRTERSSKLRDLFFEKLEKPYVCDMCDDNLTERYPWADRLLEVHHLLPLSSPVHVEKKGTSIDDLVGLCPTCHRAVHGFYRIWLKEQNKDDFDSYDEAHEVYALAKTKFNENE